MVVVIPLPLVFARSDIVYTPTAIGRHLEDSEDFGWGTGHLQCLYLSAINVVYRPHHTQLGPQSSHPL